MCFNAELHVMAAIVKQPIHKLLGAQPNCVCVQVHVD